MSRKLTEERRLAILEKWRASGLSVREFAELHKCNFYNLKYWVHRSQLSRAASSDHTFVKIKQPEVPTEKSVNRTRFTVGKGMVLEIDESFDQPFLAAAMFLVAGLTR